MRNQGCRLQTRRQGCEKIVEHISGNPSGDQAICVHVTISQTDKRRKFPTILA